MKHSDDISNTFLALNFINLSTKFKSSNKSSNINMHTIWDVILNPNKYDDQINDLLKNPTFSEVFFKILRDKNAIYKPRMIAAASDEVLKRSYPEFKIEIIKSNKDEDICYLILTFLKELKLPLSNLYIICNNVTISKKIPSLNNKQAQMILKKDEKLYKFITNPESEIFIR